ncbi:DMT family transporter [Castellaniella sp.]|uniref:DMT family transporter n=1 Tax=Castellaniella sp. TaxID=1955812 RepID=UPI00355EAC43
MRLPFPRLQDGAQTWLGPLLMCVASMMFSIMDAGTKYLSTEYPPAQVVWVRYLAQALAIWVIFWPRMRISLFRTQHIVIQIVRGLILCTSSMLVIHGLARLPLAETTAFVFLAPVFITVLSGLLLKEKATRADWIAIGCGFAGVLIIARPGGGLLTWAILLPLGAAVCNAGYQLVTRIVRSTELPATSNLYTGLVGAAVLMPVGLAEWEPMAWGDLLLLVAVGLLAATAHLAITHALVRSSAATLGPYSYAQILTATLMGWLVFSSVPDAISWLGILVIACGGLVLSFDKLRRYRAAQAEARARSASR